MLWFFVTIVWKSFFCVLKRRPNPSFKFACSRSSFVAKFFVPSRSSVNRSLRCSRSSSVAEFFVSFVSFMSWHLTGKWAFPKSSFVSSVIRPFGWKHGFYRSCCGIWSGVVAFIIEWVTFECQSLQSSQRVLWILYVGVSSLFLIPTQWHLLRIVQMSSSLSWSALHPLEDVFDRCRPA